MKLITTIIFTGFTLFTLLTGCKKDKRQPDCKIVTISNSVASSAITYDSQNRIATFTSSGATRTYVYTGTTITITETNAGVFLKRRIVTIGSNNLPVNIREERNAAGTAWVNYAMEYTGTELSRKTRTDNSGASPNVTTYVWVNGNPVSNTNGGTTSVFTFDETKPSQTGDVAWLSGVVDDWVTILKFKNRLTAINSTPVTYTFDANNQITSVSIGGTAFNYTYACN